MPKSGLSAELLGEEGGALAGNEPWQWVIDPIDGTFNFATGLPGSACSIALLYAGQARVGVLADLASGSVFRARRGHGLVGTEPGWAFDSREQEGRGRARLFLEFGGEGFDTDMLAVPSQLAAVRPIVPRLVGSAAIALFSAALKGGSFVGVGLRLWDVAAGVVLAEEAGLKSRWWFGESHIVHVLVGTTGGSGRVRTGGSRAGPWMGAVNRAARSDRHQLVGKTAGRGTYAKSAQCIPGCMCTSCTGVLEHPARAASRDVCTRGSGSDLCSDRGCRSQAHHGARRRPRADDCADRGAQADYGPGRCVSGSDYAQRLGA